MAGAASGSSSSSSGGGGGGGGGSNAGTGSNINAAGGVHAGEQQYSLRWNDFHSSILSSFRHLRDEEDFVDVTLACDSNSFTAHKVVLSACSPYFRELLKANPCQHPIVILRDVASADMESLLRFMYHGEVHVGQEQLAAFLKTAQMLQVRGLADVNSGAAASKLPSSGTPLMGSHHISSSPATPRNPWQDNGRDLNDSGMSPPPEKRPRSYSPPRSNHIEAKSDLQESLLGQALEGGPTIHTPSSNNLQAQSTGEDSNSMSDNEEDTSNNDSMLNSVKTEPSDLLNDSLEHHRNAFPILSLQGLMPGPSGIHAANQDPNYGRWQPPPSGAEGSCSAWLNSSGSAGIVGAPSASSSSQQLVAGVHVPATSQLQSQQQQQALDALSGLNHEQLTIVHQKIQNNLQNYQQQQQQNQSTTNELSLMLQSCAKKKIEELAMLHPFQMTQDACNSLQAKPKCPECGKIYSNNSNLKQHIVNVHTVQTEYISCHLCSKQFKTKQYLQIHLLSMHGIRKRKSYPVYQMPTSTHALSSTSSSQQQQQQQQQQFGAATTSSQSPRSGSYPSPDRWTELHQK